jgi:hypothetical protein
MQKIITSTETQRRERLRQGGSGIRACASRHARARYAAAWKAWDGAAAAALPRAEPEPNRSHRAHGLGPARRRRPPRLGVPATAGSASGARRTVLRDPPPPSSPPRLRGRPAHRRPRNRAPRAARARRSRKPRAPARSAITAAPRRRRQPSGLLRPLIGSAGSGGAGPPPAVRGGPTRGRRSAAATSRALPHPPQGPSRGHPRRSSLSSWPQPSAPRPYPPIPRLRRFGRRPLRLRPCDPRSPGGEEPPSTEIKK